MHCPSAPHMKPSRHAGKHGGGTGGASAGLASAGGAVGSAAGAAGWAGAATGWPAAGAGACARAAEPLCNTAKLINKKAQHDNFGFCIGIASNRYAPPRLRRCCFGSLSAIQLLGPLECLDHGLDRLVEAHLLEA